MAPLAAAGGGVRSEKKISSCCLVEDGEKSSDFVPIF